MTFARTTALILAVSVAAVASYAQEATVPLSSDRTATTSPSVRPQNDTSSLAAERAPLLATPNALLDASVPLTITPTQQAPILSEHKFWDQQQKLALAAHSAVRLADTIKTCRELAHGGVEDWIPTQSCAGIAAWNAGSVGAALGIGWLFHRYGFHRLERITPWIGTGASAAGWAKSVFNIY